MAASSPLQLTVQRCEPVLITPSEPTPYEMKYLSDIDCKEFLRYQAPVMQYYRRNEAMKFKDPVEIIRQAIGKALVYYYPLAGRLREGSNGRLMVECTGEGVLFIEANANVTFDHFPDPLLPPFPALDELLYDVPGSAGILHCPLLLIQVTRLMCGGFIFGFRHSHVMCDAFGAVQLLKAIGEMARGVPFPSVEPVWRRELLTVSDVRPDDGSVEMPSTNIRPAMEADDDMVHGLVCFSPAEITNLRRHVPSHLHSCSTFEIVTSSLWRCRIIALGPNDPDEIVRMEYALNVRNKFHPPLPVGYYGNATASAIAETTAGKLCENPLGYALDLVKKAKAAVTDQYMQSPGDYKARSTVQPLKSYVVSDLRHIGFGDIDFGWGNPVYGGPAKGNVGILPGRLSFYLPVKIIESEDDLAATFSLPSLAMRKFERELKKLKEGPPAPESVPRINKCSSAL